MLLADNKIKYSINNSEETNHLFLLQSLNDILEMTNDIEKHIISVCDTFDDFVTKMVYCPSTERCFGIINEATNRIRKVNKQIEIKNNKALIELINKDYYDINPIAVWEIVQRDILNLKVEIKDIISSLKH